MALPANTSHDCCWLVELVWSAWSDVGRFVHPADMVVGQVKALYDQFVCRGFMHAINAPIMHLCISGLLWDVLFSC
jgi:hypothetical protein